MAQIEPRTLQGFSDYYGEEMALRSFVESKIRNIFNLYEVEELSTPAIEYGDILFGKYGEEEKLIYHFNDHGDRHVALRYDQTVPLARFVAQHQNKLIFPYKRFAIGKVWRADAARKARKREFIQCDMDIIGEESPLADAESIKMCVDIFRNLNIDDCVAYVSDRRILGGLIEKEGVDGKFVSDIVRSVDKYDKIGKDGVLKDLEDRARDVGFDFNKAKRAVELIFSLIGKSFDELKKEITVTDSLDQIVKLLNSYGLKEEKDYVIDLTLVRGLDYYTGMVFEMRSKNFKGSLAGGGRFDDLCSRYSNKQFCGVGFAVGFEPVCVYLQDKGISSMSSNKVLVTVFEEKLLENSINTINALRKNNIACELYSNYSHKMKKQFKYANSKGHKYVIVIGESEAEKETIMLKNMETGEQEELTEKDLISKLGNL